MFDRLFVSPLADVFWRLTLFLPDIGWAIIIFALMVRVPLTPLYWLLFKEQKKMRLVQEKLRLQPKTKDLIQKAEIMNQVYKEVDFRPGRNLLVQFSPLPILIALLLVLGKVLKSNQSLFFLEKVNLSLPSPFLAILTIFLQLLSLNDQPAEVKKSGWITIGILGVIFFTIPALYTLYWVVILIWTLIEQRVFHWYEIKARVRSI